VALQALSASGKVLWADAFTQPIQSYNGSHRGDIAEEQSVFQSTAFPHKITRVPAVPGAATFRLVLEAVGSAKYEITEGWLNRWPNNWDGPIGVVDN
jgi:hypothetical protein